MTHQDTILALLLAARIHGTQKAVNTTAQRCAKLLPKPKRTLMLTAAEKPTSNDHDCHLKRWSWRE